ncbi:MAG: enoyl-CoA hydratase/isomerase family protein [Nitrospirota bacterium]|nr:MAG: enoyl-CoA hydratase/isomerase family protein [Nitrospirota bacterium]
MPDSDLVRFELREGISIITLNRPDALNALSRDLLEELGAILDNVRIEDAIKAVIITGAGERAFSAGADIQYLSRATPMEIRDLAQIAVEVTRKIENLGKVVVAAINGYALGGGLEIAEACMLRVAVPSARFGHPEVKVGAVSGWGGTTRLPRLIGKGRAAELLLTGKHIGADEALQIGLVNKVVETEFLMEECKALVGQILENSPLAVRLTWESLHKGLNMTLEESTLLGADYFGLIATTEDFKEGTGAFIEKRKPGFKGK